MTNAWNEWANGAQWAYDDFTARTPWLSTRVQRVSPPGAYEREHSRLLELLSEAEIVRADRSIPFPERAGQVVVAAQSFDDSVERLLGESTRGDERRYAMALRDARDRDLATYARATVKAERATAKVLRKLSRLRVPHCAKDDHVALVHGFELYLAAAERYHAECQQHLVDEAVDAANSMEMAVVALKTARRGLFASLDYGARWPDGDQGRAR